jgi:hypothetical protein
MVHDGIMEADEQQMQLRDNDVLVVAGIANQGTSLLIARKVVGRVKRVAPNEQLRTRRL